VCRRIVGVIGLDLDDAAADTVDEECRTDQRRRDLVDAPGEELAPELQNSCESAGLLDDSSSLRARRPRRRRPDQDPLFTDGA